MLARVWVLVEVEHQERRVPPSSVSVALKHPLTGETITMRLDRTKEDATIHEWARRVVTTTLEMEAGLASAQTKGR